MSDRLTPETDTYCLRAIGFPTGYEWREFARKLERQRDEARDQLDRICRDGFGYQDTIGLEPCADYVLRKLNEEREELGRLRVENDHNWQALDGLEKVTELARELRDMLQLASDLIESAGREDGNTWEPGQSWIFWEDKCAAKNDVEAIRQMLTKAKEVLP